MQMCINLSRAHRAAKGGACFAFLTQLTKVSVLMLRPRDLRELETQGPKAVVPNSSKSR